MKFIPFEPAHAFALDLQGPQRPYLEWLTPDVVGLVAAHFAITGIDEDGALVGCAGLAPEPSGALVAWALFSERIAAHGLAVTRAVKSGLALHRGRTIWAYVAPEHPKAARFAEALNFTLRGGAVHPNGSPILLYALEH